MDPWDFPLPFNVLQRGVGATPVLTVSCERFSEPGSTRALRLLFVEELRARSRRGHRPSPDATKADGTPRFGPQGIDEHGLPADRLQGSPHAQNELLVLGSGVEHLSFCDIPLLASSLLGTRPHAPTVEPDVALRSVGRMAVRFLHSRLLGRVPRHPEDPESDFVPAEDAEAACAVSVASAERLETRPFLPILRAHEAKLEAMSDAAAAKETDAETEVAMHGQDD